ncbi:uncharacterized protein LOC106671000 [Cimex lectularius]|uniref:CHK kinase-like domain-containing protein n=1 Tax=Cimex lectularius TaxID=79782 RepID=A0A8I6S6T2_CIMLE|nr:uncharacterized protein LOC106671000 [Cimex lectularius]
MWGEALGARVGNVNWTFYNRQSLPSQSRRRMYMCPEPLRSAVERYFSVTDTSCKVTICESVSVVTEENNYASDMARVIIKVTTPHMKKTLSIIVKESTLDRMVTEAIQESVDFSTEVKIYRDVFPAMENLLLEYGNNDEPLWPHCLGQLDDTKIVLQDLKELGYKIIDRQKGMDYEHASMTMGALAKFHALSVALVQRGLISPDGYSKFVFGGDFDVMNEHLRSNFETLHRAISTTWSCEWSDIIERLGKLPKKAVNILRECRKKGKFNVLNHGDPWVNNIMFRYPKGSTEPESIRFVDFQLSHYDSYAFDLHYFMSTSIAPDILPSADRLLLEYTETLAASLRFFGINDSPTYADVLVEMKRTEFFGLVAAVTVAPVVTAPPELAPPKIANAKDMPLEEIERRKLARYQTPSYSRRIEILLRRAQHGGLFDKICD